MRQLRRFPGSMAAAAADLPIPTVVVAETEQSRENSLWCNTGRAQNTYLPVAPWAKGALRLPHRTQNALIWLPLFSGCGFLFQWPCHSAREIRQMEG